MNKPSADQLAEGRERFLAAHPEVRAKIDALSNAEAEAMSTTLEKHREQETTREIEKYARGNDIDPVELMFSLAADTAEEFAQWSEAREKAIKAALGL